MAKRAVYRRTACRRGGAVRASSHAAAGSHTTALPFDLTIMDKQETGHNDLPLRRDAIKSAVLGFDLKFHAGYDATVPLKELGGGKRQPDHGVPGDGSLRLG